MDDDDDIPDDLPDIDYKPEIKPKIANKSKNLPTPKLAQKSKPKLETKPKPQTTPKPESKPSVSSVKVSSRIEELPDEVEVCPETSKPGKRQFMGFQRNVFIIFIKIESL